jgi:hypothetical protein
MFQCGMPLSYDNLKAYNSQLPFPNLNLGLTPPANDTGGVTYQQQYQPTDGTVNQINAQSATPAPIDDDDDFDDFVDSNTPQAPQEPKELTAEEKRKIEEEERLKRIDLISSAFDDALFDEPEEGEEKKEESKEETVLQEQPKQVQQTEEQKAQPSGNSWANFDSSEQQNQANTGWQNQSAGWDTPRAQDIQKSDEKHDDDFDDFVDSSESKPKQEQSASDAKVDDDPFSDAIKEETKQQEIVKTPQKTEPEKKPSESVFPSLFDQASTPRLNNDEDDEFKMSFPSQEMWKSEFEGKESKEEHKEPEPTKLQPPKNTGWASAAFDFKSTRFAETKPVEEDDFKDIMDMKQKNETKDNDDSFEDFTEPTPKGTQANAKDENVFNSEIKNTKNQDTWGSFKFPDEVKETNQEVKADGWSSFSTPINPPSATKTKPTSPDLSDPLNSPFQDAFKDSQSDVTPSNSQVHEDKDDDSDFGEFEDAVDAPVSSQREELPRLEDDQDDSKGSDLFNPVSDTDPFSQAVPVEEIIRYSKPKAFNEKEMFLGFLNTVNKLPKNKDESLDRSSFSEPVKQEPSKFCSLNVQ